MFNLNAVDRFSNAQRGLVFNKRIVNTAKEGRAKSHLDAMSVRVSCVSKEHSVQRVYFQPCTGLEATRSDVATWRERRERVRVLTGGACGSEVRLSVLLQRARRECNS